jgi:pimeloyl-ACP methyl ester carboxylesterase
VTKRGRTVATLLLVAVAFGAGVWSSYRNAIGRARERSTSGSEIAQTRCGPIEYAVVGTGRPMLLVHGAGGGFDQGLDIGVESGFRVIAPSRFGYLRTPLPADASAVAQADAHACLLDALDVPRAAVIGVSAGAPSAMQLALRHPERTAALVLMVPAAYVPRPGGAPSLATPPRTPIIFETALKFDVLFWAATRVVPETMQRSVLATPPEVVRSASADEQARVAAILEHILPVSSRRLGLLNDAAVVSRLERYELEKIAVPTLVISLEDDLYGTFEPARYTADQVPGARFVGYPTGGHVWVGHHEEVMSEIRQFLGDVEAAGTR